MKKLIILIIILIIIESGKCIGKGGEYKGKFCSGSGDAAYLQLIDESFAFFHPRSIVPNLSMVYQPDWNTFEEGAGWGAWWIQNSYGFSYSATPFIDEPWFSVLQRSLDLFWDNQGDGKRKGRWGDGGSSRGYELIAPDGALGDAAAPGKIMYKQGDGDISMHDWFYEATAAGVVMQSEILLVARNQKAIEHYLPKMERACDFIEKSRDPANNLFLVGPACNLLAPSYGGVKQIDGSFGKGYLSGLTITYLAALDRMVELYKFIEDLEKLQEYRYRQKITRESLSQLLAPGGYFIKSLETGGKKHGVLGQAEFNYLEGVANADAVALRVANHETAKNIYKQIADYPAIRPFDFLLTNAPGLDDTYWCWGKRAGKEAKGFHKFGCWVNGGAWGTVEGRAILMYYRLRKYDDIRRSAYRAMKWAKDFRMDAPWSQQGENTDNPWSDSGRHKIGEVAVMIDNFAIPAATIRGLFDYEYLSDRLILRPRIPGSITEYEQFQPVRFGKKKIFLSCKNGGKKITSVKVNGQKIEVSSMNEAVLLYNELPMEAEVEITTGGGWSGQSMDMDYPSVPALISNKSIETEIPESLKKPFDILSKMRDMLEGEPGSDYERAFAEAAIQSIEAYRDRTIMDPGEGYFRPVNSERENDIINFYEQAALKMYKGFSNQMKKYRETGSSRQKRIAAMFYALRE